MLFDCNKMRTTSSKLNKAIAINDTANYVIMQEANYFLSKRTFVC